MPDLFPLPPLRPPGAADEADFRRLCTRCGKCVAACPHDSIELAGGLFAGARRFPRILPERAPCYLCMKCPPVCPTGALDPRVDEPAAARMGRAYIKKSRCHNYREERVMCMTCFDRCPLRGRAVVLVAKEKVYPAMTTACVGCGVCEYVCPEDAVVVAPASFGWAPPDAAPVLERQ